MEISTTEYRHCHVVKVNGRIDSATAPDLGSAFNNIQKSGQYRIVFDMSGVDYISSSGLRVLINTQKASKRYNRGEVVLACVNPKVADALELAGFKPFFKIFDDLTSAVGNF